jgi:hypothetical protein
VDAGIGDAAGRQKKFQGGALWVDAVEKVDDCRFRQVFRGFSILDWLARAVCRAIREVAFLAGELRKPRGGFSTVSASLSHSGPSSNSLTIKAVFDDCLLKANARTMLDQTSSGAYVWKILGSYPPSHSAPRIRQ